MPAVNSLHRGLLILRAVNNGHAQVREISAATKLPKSTIARMLETLVADGYVSQDASVWRNIIPKNLERWRERR